MNGYERTKKFIAGEKVDRPPYMPLVIDWVAIQHGLDQETFVYDPIKRAEAYIAVCDKYDIDCILPDSDFHEQLEDFGEKPVLSDTGYHADTILDGPEDVKNLPTPTFAPGTRMGNRLVTLKKIVDERKGQKFIFGICIGPFTEYTNARGLEDAMCEFLEDEDETMEGINFFLDNCMTFIEKQMELGIDGIQIVEPSCSLISPAMYEEYIMPLHTKMVEKIQNMGGVARIHICGDTLRIMPYTLGTGSILIDADKEVDMAAAAKLLGDGQYFVGNISPAEDLYLGDPSELAAKVKRIHEATNGRTILAAGCDVAPPTPVENMIAFHDAVAALAE
jgi:MtaA/CmuA family methyltransferase